METELPIRAATPADTDGLRRCMESAYAVYLDCMGGMQLPPMDADYAAEIRNYPCWVIESSHRIIGGLIMDFANGKATIANIAIDPEFQGQGIGGRLIKHAVTIAMEQNFANLYLTTHVLLDENISLYRYLGWQEIARDESRIFMRKTL